MQDSTVFMFGVEDLFYPENAGRRFLRNYGAHLPNHKE
jgi:hypothetical protein